MKRIEELELDKNEEIEKKRNIKLFKYVGETRRSAYERGWEHLNDFGQLKTSSHMLKHAVGQHEGQDTSEIKLGMKIICQAKLSFERQIAESVLIQAERKKHTMLNSRAEYNRCSSKVMHTSRWMGGWVVVVVENYFSVQLKSRPS